MIMAELYRKLGVSASLYEISEGILTSNIVSRQQNSDR